MLSQSIINKYGFKEGLVIREGKIIKWPYDVVQPSAEELQLIEKLFVSRDKKVKELKTLRDKEFKEPVLVRSNPDIYLKPQPESNIFLAAHSMEDGSTKEWRICDSEGNMLDQILEITKGELLSASSHYEERKTLAYNQYHKKCFELKNSEDLDFITNYDINKIIV